MGSTFPLVFESQKHSALFYYSKYCHACKSYGGIYEHMALDHAKSETLDFYRFNSNKNNTNLLKNYLYTPIFMVLRKEDKSKPFIYRSSFMNKKLLEDFISITSSFSILDAEVYAQA